jgi:predicted ATPase
MSDPQIRFGPFALDVDPVRLWRGSDCVELRPKSLKVLHYLAARSGQLVTKGELFEQVWSGRVVSESGLRLCVREIRAALEDNAGAPQYLETVVGRGYRFLEGRDGRALLPDVAGPMVGRDSELLQLEDYYRSVVDGRSRFVLLGGEPGIGKTTLLNAFLDRVSQASSAMVTQGQCVVHYGKEEPFGPLLEAVARLCHAENGTQVIEILKRHAPMWLMQLPGLIEPFELERIQHQVEGAGPERMSREFCHVVENLTVKAPLILVVEDLHWADVSTLDLLATLAQYPEASRLLLLGTYRPADAVLYASSLRDIVRELKGHGDCEEMLLESLSNEDIGTYLNVRLRGAIADDLSTRIYRRTNGNPLFFVNLIEFLIRQQMLVRRDDCWAVSEKAQQLEESVPESLRSLILRRFEALSEESRQILETASVVGPEFSGAATSAGLDQDSSEIDAKCEALAAQGQFIEATRLETWPDGTMSGRYRFQHPLYVEVLYEQLGEARRARIHRRVAERLEQGYGDRVDEVATTLATHFDRGREPDREIRYRKLAAEQALKYHAYPEVIEQLERGLDAITQLPECVAKSEDELELLMLLGPCLIATQGYAAEEVEHTYNRAQQLYERLEKESYHFPILWNLAGFRMVRAELARSGPLVHQLLELANASGEEESVLMAHSALGQQLFFEGSFEPANLQFDQVMSRYDIERHGALADVYSQEDPGIMSTSMDALVLWFLGFPDESTARTESALEIAEKLSNPHSLALCLIFNSWLCQLRGDAKATQEQAENLIEICSQHSIYWISFGRMLRGWAIAQQTAQPEGLELVRQGLDEWRAGGSELGVPYCLGLLGETYRALGQIDAAQSSVEEALLLVDKKYDRWFESELHRLQGELELVSDNGDREVAADCFARSLRVAREQQARSLELRAALSLSRLWLQQGRSREAYELLEPISAWFPAALETSELADARSLLRQHVP